MRVVPPTSLLSHWGEEVRSDITFVAVAEGSWTLAKLRGAARAG